MEVNTIKKNRAFYHEWIFLVLLTFCFGSRTAYAHFETTPNSPIQISKEGKISYKAAPNGDRVPDFSYCGYMASEKELPNVPVKIIVPITTGDATAAIQSAIDHLSALPLNSEGFRGAILLENGTYKVAGSLSITASGVVLRGSGCGLDGTIIEAAGVDRETLIHVGGKSDRSTEPFVSFDPHYYPVNSTQFFLQKGHGFKVGDQVLVNRPSTKEWLERLGADKIGSYVDYTLTNWEPGDFDQNWYRTVVAVTPESVTLDVPLPNSIDPKYGGGQIARYRWPGRISHVGVENLRCISTYETSNVKDENHRWMAITLENIEDGWVRRIIADHFVSSAVAIWETARRITVEDCKSLAPVGEIGNYRRYAFHTTGQQILFQRCYAEYAYHAFSVGFTASGPNAFVQCYSYMPSNFSGAIGGWATGLLFDKMTIDGGILSLAYRDVDGQGGGWSAANSLCWQCKAAQIHLPAPPTAQNWAYASWAQGYGDGHHELQHTFVKPESFFYAQLEARTGRKFPGQEHMLMDESGETTAPTIEMAARWSERSKFPDLTMDQWIDKVIAQFPIVSDLTSASKMTEAVLSKQVNPPVKKAAVTIKNGWIVQGDQLLTGKKNRTSLWRGSTRPSELAKPAPNLVRFVPGRIGRGLTDNLDTLVDDMLKNRVAVMQNFPALWYERRRDDHARTRRADADVWAPFYEQPFSRSGQGEAFDRLSKYDLTKWNSWYWLRLKQFADLADRTGLLFLEEHYLQHNIIEEGAHWADYPWRSANNINDLGFAENPHYAGDKRVYMAVEFYDTTQVIRKAFHKAYIRKSLDNFSNNANIIHHLGMEYTGPLHFVQFWLDVIAAWEREHHKKVMVMLPGTKEVQEAILADPRRAAVVDVIEVNQWQYRKDGTLFAPPGGVSLAERQYARLFEVGESSFAQIYRAVKELKIRFPEKAVVYSRRGDKLADWASFMAGGSLVNLPEMKMAGLLQDATEMNVMESEDANLLMLGKIGIGFILFSRDGKIKWNGLSADAKYTLTWINPTTGWSVQSKTVVKSGITTELISPFEGAAVAWLKKK